jgi:hypothetical protein
MSTQVPPSRLDSTKDFSSLVPAAFTQANSSFGVANSASLYANGAFSSANLKFNSAGGTISGDVSITGNLSILGNTFSVSSSQIVANDTMFIMGIGNYTTDILDIGFVSHYNNGTNAHTGLIRDAAIDEWLLFESYTPEIGGDNNIDINHASFNIATLNANLKSTTITVKSIDLLPYVNNAFNTANSAGSYANSAFIQANSVFSQSNNQVWPQANAAFATANTSANVYLTVALSDETTSITTGTAKVTFRAPHAMTLYQIPRASLATASTSGIPEIDINKNGTTIFGTRLTIDANEKTSVTAATPAVLSTTTFADDDEISMDIDVAGTGAKGLKVTLYYRRT